MFQWVSCRKPNTFEVDIDYWEFIGNMDPFHDFVFAYAAKYELEVKTVDFLYQYKFVDDEYDIRIYWFSSFSIFIYIPNQRNMEIIKHRIIEVINDLNDLLRDQKAQQKLKNQRRY